MFGPLNVVVTVLLPIMLTVQAVPGDKLGHRSRISNAVGIPPGRTLARYPQIWPCSYDV